MSKQQTPINDQIQAETVRLIGEDGTQHGIKPIKEARSMAEDAGLDIVLVATNSEPPVAKIMDYGKFKYQQKKRQHEHHHHQPQLKELRMRPKTEQHDLMVRVKKAREFLERGDRVQVTVMFRGREMTHTEMGRAVLEKFYNELEDLAKIEQQPRMEGRRMHILLAKK